MAPRTRPSSLAPRLMLLFAVLGCLLGLGQAGAAAETASMGSMPMALAADSGHVAHQLAPAMQNPADSSLGISAEGHAGHGSTTAHAMNCMSAAAVAASGAVALADVANTATAALIAPMSRLHTAILVESYRRAPDITTLCVQRI